MIKFLRFLDEPHVGEYLRHRFFFHLPAVYIQSGKSYQLAARHYSHCFYSKEKSLSQGAAINADSEIIGFIKPFDVLFASELELYSANKKSKSQVASGRIDGSDIRLAVVLYSFSLLGKFTSQYNDHLKNKTSTKLSTNGEKGEMDISSH